jgi:hypothetical protein
MEFKEISMAEIEAPSVNFDRSKKPKVIIGKDNKQVKVSMDGPILELEVFKNRDDF